MSVDDRDLEVRLTRSLDAAASRGPDAVPDWAGVQQRARRNRARRATALGMCVSLALAAATGAVLAASSDRSDPHPPVAAPGAALTRPLLATCRAVWATELDVPGRPEAEVFASADGRVLARVSTTGAVGVPGDGLVGAAPANTMVGNREGALRAVETGGAALQYERSDGTVREIVARGLSDIELGLLGARLDAGSGSLPAGLEALGPPGAVHAARSQCASEGSHPPAVVAVTGDRAGRVNFVLGLLTSISWERNGSTLAVIGDPDRPTEIRQATVREWTDLLRAGAPDASAPTIAPR